MDGSSAAGGITNNGTLTISAGSFSTAAGRIMTTNAGATTTISGGTVSIGASLGDSFRGAGTYVFSGGNTTATGRFRADASTILVTLGGTATGSLTATGWHGSWVTTGGKVDWLSGSKMAMTISGVADWAATEWAAGRMTYNGQGVGTLGDWATVSADGGLGGGASFSYESATKTLTLIPEPSSLGLLGLAGLATLLRRRRRG